MRGKVVLITGSSMGIGRYTAYKFASSRAKLVLTYYKNKEEGELTIRECERLGAEEATLLHLDLTNNKSIKNCVQETASRYGKIDILINNAGVLAWKPLREQSFEEIEFQLRVNLGGALKLTKLALPLVRELVINVGSRAGKMGFAELTTYCSTKFGLRGFTQALAQEEESIKVVCVNPGMTATRMTNFQGVHPKEVAEIIFKTASGEITCPSGGDVDVWEFL